MRAVIEPNTDTELGHHGSVQVLDPELVIKSHLAEIN